ncbi:MAG: hypothetical protein FJ109_17625, partial [Deltaproteobacteria bacterium]|nr:hypothetical protein [Deltaproteobacteria bacterium]
GFFTHASDWVVEQTPGAFWARGNGWVMASGYSYLQQRILRGEDDPQVKESLSKLAAAVLAVQDPASGLWWTMLSHIRASTTSRPVPAHCSAMESPGPGGTGLPETRSCPSSPWLSTGSGPASPRMIRGGRSSPASPVPPARTSSRSTARCFSKTTCPTGSAP